MRYNIIVIQLGGKCCSYNFNTTSYLKQSANGSAMLDSSDQFRIFGSKWFMNEKLFCNSMYPFRFLSIVNNSFVSLFKGVQM